jgi:predicted nucleotidyltransferase
MTADVDVDVLLDKGQVLEFLNKLKKCRFQVDLQTCQRNAKRRGVFQINYEDFHIDFIIASIGLERQAFRRKKSVKLYGLKIFFPTIEDFILLKIIAGRPQDLIDAEKVVIRQRGRLDKKYLKMWAQRLSDEA